MAQARTRFTLAGIQTATKETHPREWAVFTSIDEAGKGQVNLEELRHMCQQMGVEDHLDKLAEELGATENHAVTFQEFCDHFEAVKEVRSLSRLRQWDRCLGLGVAGNVAGHMAQAGEADPAAGGGHASEPKTPAAIFVFYLPPADLPDSPTHLRSGASGVALDTFPVTNSVIQLPHIEGGGKVQVEPELAVHAQIVYKEDGKTVERLEPMQVAAFNDCSMRQLEGSVKLSEKKNWGFGSKGMSISSFSVDSFAPGTLLDRLILVSYVKRKGQTYQYSKTAPVRSYLMFYEPLLEWIVDRMNNQKDCGKWEDISECLAESAYPTHTWIALGAGEYTPWGETNYLEPGDEAVVVVYDQGFYPEGHEPDAELVELLFNDRPAPPGVVALHQTFV